MIFSLIGIALLCEIIFILIAAASGADAWEIPLSHLAYAIFIAACIASIPTYFAANRCFTYRVLGFSVLTAFLTLTLWLGAWTLQWSGPMVSLGAAPLPSMTFLPSGDTSILIERIGPGAAESVYIVEPDGQTQISRFDSLPVSKAGGTTSVGDYQIDSDREDPMPWLSASIAAAFGPLIRPFRESPGWIESLAMAFGIACCLAGAWGFTRVSSWPLFNLALAFWAVLGALFLQAALDALIAFGQPVPELVREHPELARASACAVTGLALLALDLLLSRKTEAVRG
jgi:hypothetical protein